MTALADLSDIVNRLTGGNSGTPQHIFSFLDGRVQAAAATAPIAARWTSFWRYNQTDGANGALPSSVTAPDRTTLGAMPIDNPGGGREQWLLGIEAALSQACTVLCYDRLLQKGGLSGNSTSAQTVGGTLTRYTGGEGNQIWVEIGTIIGTTATTITASYTNQAGTSGRTTKAVSIGGTGLREEERFIPLTLADGDTGVQAVASVTLAGLTGTAGDFAVVVLHPLAMSPNAANQPNTRDLIAGLPAVQELQTDACVAWAALSSTTTAYNGCLALHVIEA